MAVTAKKNLRDNISSNWKLRPEKEYYTYDDLIDAYLKGKEEQKNQTQKVLIEKLEKNLRTAKSIVENITDEIISKDFKTFKSYLRIKDIFKFDAIFDISLQDFTSDSFEEIYTYSRKIKKEVSNDTFNINFTFMPHTEDLNEKRIVCDGFILVYEKRG